jgi:dephospho-CoA kinase
MDDHKPVIGLAGGIGSGKSAVAQEMARLGARVFDADAMAKQELNSQEVKDTLLDWHGPEILDPDGSVSRPRLADRVFDDPEAKAKLEMLIHPRVRRRRQELMREAESDDSVKAIVLDVPLLFEVGMQATCDAVVFVDTPEDVRLARVAESRGWDPAELKRREKTHKSLDFKKVRADYTIDNGSDRELLRQQVERVFPKILSSVTSQKHLRNGPSGANPGVAGN